MQIQKKTLAIMLIVSLAVGFTIGFCLVGFMQGQILLSTIGAFIFTLIIKFCGGAEILRFFRDSYREERKKPKLSIDYDKDNSIFFPEADIIDTNRNKIGKRKYQKICVKNSGGVARNCEAELQLINRNNSTIHPSKEPKLLVWWTSSKDNILLKQDIRGGIGAKYLYVVFLEEFFANKLTNINDIYAFVSTKEEVYRGDILTRYNGFGVGEFEFKVTVASEDGAFVKSIFRFHVNKDFRRSSMEKISEVNK